MNILLLCTFLFNFAFYLQAMESDVPFNAIQIYTNIVNQIKDGNPDILNVKLDCLPVAKKKKILGLLCKPHTISTYGDKIINQKFGLTKWKHKSTMVAVADDMISVFKEDQLTTHKYDISEITALEWMNSSILVGHENGKIYVHNIRMGQNSPVAHLKKPIKKLFVNPNKQNLIGVRTESGLSIKELGNLHLKDFGSLSYQIKADAMYWNPVNVNSFAVHDDSSIRFYELDVKGKFIVPKKKILKKDICLGSWCPDGQCFAYAIGNSIELLDRENDKLHLMLQNFGSAICDIAWIDNGMLAVSLSHGAIEIIKVSSGQVTNNIKISDSGLKLNQSPFDPNVFGIVDKNVLKIINVKTGLCKEVKDVSSESSVEWAASDSISFFNNERRLTTIKMVPATNDSNIGDAIKRLYDTINPENK